MTALTAAVSPADSQITIDVAIGVYYGSPYTLGSENIMVVGGTGTTTLSVARGVNGTQGVSHAAGTPLMAGWGGGGGAQIVSLLGPVHLHFDTAGFVNPADDGPTLFTIPAGGLYTVAPVVVETFDVVGDLVIVAGEASGLNTKTIAQLSPALGIVPSAWVYGPPGTYPAAPTTQQVADHLAYIGWDVAVQASAICAGFYPDGAGPTAGAVDIYVLVATPA